MKSFVLPVIAKPLPSDLISKVSCTCCQARCAKWELGSMGVSLHYSCSICLLYNQPFAKDQREAVDALIKAVEEELRERFARGQEDRLVADTEADRVAGGIVMAQRYEQLRGLAGNK